MSSLYQNAQFLLSVAHIKQLPPDEGIEVVIAGRSNSGKSSVLNCITQKKALARVSKTPGRTQLINIFVLDDNRRLLDLPGYGYAKVPQLTKENWEKLTNAYFRIRQSLKGLILVMDARHPLRELDQMLLQYCQERALPVHIVLNKMDKLSQSQGTRALQQVEEKLKAFSNPISLQGFSALKRNGIEALRAFLDGWYEV